MVTGVLSTRVKEIQPLAVTPLDEVVETIRDDALALAQERLTAPLRGLELKRLLRRPEFVESFKHGLALGIANTLSAHDAKVTDIYTFDPSANPDSDLSDTTLDLTVHLLVVVQNTSAAMEAFIASLDRALTVCLNSLPSPKFEQRQSILDVNILTARDVEQGRGYAILLKSVVAPALKVWQR